MDTSRQTKNLNKLLIRILLHLQVEFSSYNKMLLISRLFYFMRLTRNVNFKDSDESLKGVLKTYANKLPHTESAIYGF